MGFSLFLLALCFVFLGCCSGIITGLIPGIHVNLITTLVLALYTNTSFLNLTTQVPNISFYVSLFIVSMAIVHTFLDSIPSIYLGAPDEAQALIVLPGHRMLLRGLGHNAVRLTIIGSFLTLLMAVLFSPILAHLVSKLYPITKGVVPYILIIISLYMILKGKNKFKSLIVFISSGALGLVVLNSNIKQPLFPLLSGLFGLSILIVSLSHNVKIPKQKNRTTIIRKKDVLKPSILALMLGLFASFLPGLGNSQAVIIGQNLFKRINDKIFMIMISGINTANFTLSLITLYLVNKARNGAIVGIKELLGSISVHQLLIYMCVALMAGSFAVIVGIIASRMFSKMINRISYKKIIYCVMIFISLLTIIISGPKGLLVLITSTSLGLITSFFGVGKHNLMGCLIIPVILYFLM